MGTARGLESGLDAVESEHNTFLKTQLVGTEEKMKKGKPEKNELKLVPAAGVGEENVNW